MSKENAGRTTESGARILRVLFAMKGHSLHGVSNGDLAKHLGESPSTINRLLNTMVEEGAAKKLDNGRYALSVKVLGLSQALWDELDRGQSRISELKHSVLASSRQ
jgi:DNA-binding IclR family transcriptional regulator